MKIPSFSSFFWTVAAVVVAMTAVVPQRAEAGGKDKASHTIIVKGGC